MADSNEIPSIFIDTCCIEPDDKNILHLLELSKVGKIKIFISEVVIWERCKGRGKLNSFEFFSSQTIPLSILAFKERLESKAVCIVEHSSSIIERADVFINNDFVESENNFNQNNTNELRDAHIIAAAESVSNGELIIISEDKKFPLRVPELTNLLKIETSIEAVVQHLDIDISNLEDVKLIKIFTDKFKNPLSISLTSILNYLDPEYYELYEDQLKLYEDHLKEINYSEKLSGHKESINLTSSTNKLEDKLKLISSDEEIIRKRILGYIRWLAPDINKEKLYNLLKEKGHSLEDIDTNVSSLINAGMLIETKNHLISNAQDQGLKEIAEQAMECVMDEILEIMELN